VQLIQLTLHDFINLTVHGKEKVNKLHKALHYVIFSNSVISSSEVYSLKPSSHILLVRKEKKVSYAYKITDKFIIFTFIEQPRHSASMRTDSAGYTVNIRDLSTGVKRLGTWSWPLTPTTTCVKKEMSGCLLYPLYVHEMYKNKFTFTYRRKEDKAFWTEE